MNHDSGRAMADEIQRGDGFHYYQLKNVEK